MIVSHHTACTRTSAATNQHLDPRTYQRQNNGLVLAHKCASTKVPADHTCVYSALVNSRTLPQTPILAVIQAKGYNKSAHGGAAYRVLVCKRRPEGRSDTNRSVFEQANLWAPQANSRSPAQGLRRPCAARDLELCSGVHSTRSLDPVQAGPQCATLSRPGCSLASQPQHRRPAARRRPPPTNSAQRTGGVPPNWCASTRAPDGARMNGEETGARSAPVGLRLRRRT